MFTAAGEPEKIHSNDIVYWLASLCHHLGDLTSTVSWYRIDEFGTSAAFQEEYREGNAERDLRDHSRYFGAIASHKSTLSFAPSPRSGPYPCAEP
jgi:hypothetical protein